MSSPCRRFRSNFRAGGAEILCYNDRFYSLKDDGPNPYPYSFVMYRLGWPKKCHVSLPYPVAISKLFGTPFLYVLLGDNDDERLRTLAIPASRYIRHPAEIKTSRLTWGEAQAELNRRWEEKYGDGDYAGTDSSDDGDE